MVADIAAAAPRLSVGKDISYDDEEESMEKIAWLVEIIAMMLTGTSPFSGFECSLQRWQYLSTCPDDEGDDAGGGDDFYHDCNDEDDDVNHDFYDDDETCLCSFSPLWLCILDLGRTEEASILGKIMIFIEFGLDDMIMEWSW